MLELIRNTTTRTLCYGNFTGSNPVVSYANLAKSAAKKGEIKMSENKKKINNKKDAADSQSSSQKISNQNNRYDIVFEQYPIKVVKLSDKGDLLEIVDLGKHTYQLDFDLKKISFDWGERAKEIETDNKSYGDIGKDFSDLAKKTDAKHANDYDIYELCWKYVDITLDGIPRSKIQGYTKIDLSKLTKPVLDLAIKEAKKLKKPAQKKGDTDKLKKLNNYSRKIENMPIYLVPQDKVLLLRWLAIRRLKINSTVGAQLIVDAYKKYYNLKSVCIVCKKRFSSKGIGNKAKYCSKACRQKAYRRRNSDVKTLGGMMQR